jgi:hypothetical protein
MAVPVPVPFFPFKSLVHDVVALGWGKRRKPKNSSARAGSLVLAGAKLNPVMTP